jgi:hypothetical protein
VGGLYGVSMGKVFFGESMFSLVSNASKIAFVYLVQNMDYELIDCQVTTDVVDEDLTFSNSPVLPQAESPIITKVNAINLIIFFILSSLI